MSNKKKILFIILVVLSVIVIGIMCTKIYFLILKNNDNSNRHNESEKSSFTYSLIKESNSIIGKENYMISPYSIEVALSMLREGASKNTLDELNSVVPERKIKDLSIKDRVNIANGVFIKNQYKKSVLESYKDKLKNDYDSEFIYDDFYSPDKINDWVKDKTNGMIPKTLDSISKDYVMGLSNAIGADLLWDDSFKCETTSKRKFNSNGKEIDVFMMNKTFESGVAFYQDDDFDSVIIPYKKYNVYTGKEVKDDKDEGEQLEFIGILPNNIDQFIDKFDEDTLEKINKNKEYASDNQNVYVELPRFSFDYDFKKFQKILNNLGLNDMFKKESADFSNMINVGVYVSKSVHKTHIEVDEKGTKAAAITYFGMDKNSVSFTDTFNIIFNKPFVFLIKDTSSNEILFFGVVYNPTKWNDNDKKC